MNYQLQITKRELNPEFQEKGNYYYREVPQYLEENVLLVEITEQQFESIRKSVIEKF